MEHRKASIQRNTKETTISVSVDVDGAGVTDIATGIDFLDHIITSFGRHAMLDLEVRAKSNDRIEHHLIEDTAIALGQAVDDALGERDGIVRFGLASVPMDESLAVAAVDLVMRPFCKLTLQADAATAAGFSRGNCAGGSGALFSLPAAEHELLHTLGGEIRKQRPPQGRVCHKVACSSAPAGVRP